MINTTNSNTDKVSKKIDIKDIHKLLSVIKSFEGEGYLFKLRIYLQSTEKQYMLLNYTTLVNGVKDNISEETSKLLDAYVNHKLDLKGSKKELEYLVTEFNKISKDVKLGSINHFKRCRLILYVNTAKDVYKRSNSDKIALCITSVLMCLCWGYLGISLTTNTSTLITSLIASMLGVYHTIETLKLYHSYLFDRKIYKAIITKDK